MNNHISMYILYDIYLEANGMNLQIDYIIVIKSGIYIVQCKNLYGNIIIDKNGNFIREYEWNGKKTKESIYSSITQNERYIEFIKYLVMKKIILFKKIFFKIIFMMFIKISLYYRIQKQY